MNQLLKIFSCLMLSLALNSCNGNLCDKHADCQEADVCYTDDAAEQAWCIGAGVGATSSRKIFENNRKCNANADCASCVTDEDWGCLNVGGTIHNCVLRTNGVFPDPLVGSPPKCPYL